MIEEQKDKNKVLKSNNICIDNLELKVSAQVLCICNLDMDNENQICNGSQGKIISLAEEGPYVRFNNGEERTIGYKTWKSEIIPDVGIQQIPLILSWAITVKEGTGYYMEISWI